MQAPDTGLPFNYHPHPVDMTNLTLSREMQNMGERLAENAHDIWAKKKMEELKTCGGLCLIEMKVLLTDDFNEINFCRKYSFSTCAI